MVNMTPKEAYFKCLNENKKISELEEIIATDPEYSYYYARYIIKGSWEQGEEAISNNIHYSFLYASNIIKRPFELGEEAISKNSEYSYMYARIIQEPFERGEEVISKDPRYSYHYARDIIQRPFEKSHNMIFQSEWRDIYIDYLKSINYDLNKITEWLI